MVITIARNSNVNSEPICPVAPITKIFFIQLIYKVFFSLLSRKYTLFFHFLSKDIVYSKKNDVLCRASNNEVLPIKIKAMYGKMKTISAKRSC